MMKLSRTLFLNNCGKKPPTKPLAFTSTTTTANKQITLFKLKPAGGSVVISWGDGQTTTVTSGSTSNQKHTYVNPGTYKITFDHPERIVELDLRDSTISINLNKYLLPQNLTWFGMYGINSFYNMNLNPLPETLTSLVLGSLPNFIYNADTHPLPPKLSYLSITSMPKFYCNINNVNCPFNTLTLVSSPNVYYNVNQKPISPILQYVLFSNQPGIIYDINQNPLPNTLLYFSYDGAETTGNLVSYNVNLNPPPNSLTTFTLANCSTITWDINASTPWPTNAIYAIVTNCPNVKITEWTKNNIQIILFENGCTQAEVDTIIKAIYDNRANFTYATPSLRLNGGGNATPSGTYQNSATPTTGQEYRYKLINDPDGEGFKKWDVRVN